MHHKSYFLWDNQYPLVKGPEIYLIQKKFKISSEKISQNNKKSRAFVYILTLHLFSLPVQLQKWL